TNPSGNGADQAPMDAGSLGFETVTVTVVAGVVLPSTSRATAVTEWLPLVSAPVFQKISYGAATSSTPKLLPSSLNCTPAMPPASVAFAVIFSVPVTTAPADGAVMVTTGGVVS